MLETDRLVLRRWRIDDDLAPFAAICGDAEVMRFLGDGSVPSPGVCAEMIRSYERHWEEHGFGLYATALRAGGELVGAVGLSVPTFLPEILPAVEVGWRLHRSRWGTGLATEAARAALRHGFEALGCDEIVSIHQIGNRASERVMEKLGMRLVRETIHPSVWRPLRVHAIAREVFLAEMDR